MALDTANKRASAIGIDHLWNRVLPIPDGTVSDADKQQLLGKYSGIAFAPPSPGGTTNNLPRLNVG